MTSSCVLISCGSFNPITVMHTRMFELAKHYLKANKDIHVVKGIVSPTNDRYAVIKPSLSPAYHRLAMIKLALKDIEGNWIKCEDWETKQDQWVKTLPALMHYASVYGSNIKLLCGADLLESFLVPNLWKDDDIVAILRNFGIVTLPRQGSKLPELFCNSAKAHIFKKYMEQIYVIEDVCPIDISSTKVRQSVKEGKPLKELVHHDVAVYIQKHGLYKY